MGSIKIKKDTLAVVVPLVLIVVLAIAIGNINRIFPSPAAASKLNEIRHKVNYNASSSMLGTSPNATVTLIEFSDFQCPACQMAVPEVQKVIEYYGDEVNVVFKHFPIKSGSAKAAEAAECARDQGKFWEYHDILFEEYHGRESSLSSYATDLGLNVFEFNSCLRSGEKSAKVEADFAEGYRNGIKGTPTFFVNDIMLQGVHSFEDFRQVIDMELGK